MMIDILIESSSTPDVCQGSDEQFGRKGIVCLYTTVLGRFDQINIQKSRFRPDHTAILLTTFLGIPIVNHKCQPQHRRFTSTKRDRAQ